MTIPQVPEPEPDDDERDDKHQPKLPEEPDLGLPDSEIPDPKLPDSDLLLPDDELGTDHSKPRKQAR
jgi:hypothetical protein